MRVFHILYFNNLVKWWTCNLLPALKKHIKKKKSKVDTQAQEEDDNSNFVVPQSQCKQRKGEWESRGSFLIGKEAH